MVQEEDNICVLVEEVNGYLEEFIDSVLVGKVNEYVLVECVFVSLCSRRKEVNDCELVEEVSYCDLVEGEINV